MDPAAHSHASFAGPHADGLFDAVFADPEA